MSLRTLIVEDEPLARRSLRQLVEEIDWLDLLGESADGRRAVEMIDELKPDLIFLDVQMPELSGIEVLAKVRHQPAVVFTTAFDRYAVAAFELEAIDYLIKPFGRRRFRASLERVQRRLGDTGELPPTEERLRTALAQGPLRRVFARKGNKIVPLRIETVTRIEACDDYSEVHCKGETYLLQTSISGFESRLDPARFLRVHRSHMINLDHVEQLRPYDDRRLEVRLIDGSKVVASRAGSRKLREMIG